MATSEPTENKKKFVKRCFAPGCAEDSNKNPHQLFFKLPDGIEIHREWALAVGRIGKHTVFHPSSGIFCCEDHFNMVRNYVRKTSGPTNLWITMPDRMRECVEKVKKKKMTKRRAAEYLGTSVKTFYRNMKDENRGQRRWGKRKVFTEEEEEFFLENAHVLFRNGLPFTHFNLRMMVATLLNRQNRVVSTFKNNIPGPEWAQSFVNRHRELYQLETRDKRLPPKNVESLITFIEKNLPVTLTGVKTLLETNPTVKMEVLEDKEVAANSSLLEVGIKTEIEELIEESNASYADDPLATEESPLRRVPGDDVREFHNYAFVKIEEENKFRTEEDFENEPLQSLDRTKQTTQPGSSRDIQIDKRSRIELKEALCISQCNTKVWKTKFSCLQKRYNCLLEEFQNFEKVMKNLRSKQIVSRDAVDKLFEVVSNSLKRKKLEVEVQI